jgi:hypothetical protein
MTSAGVLNLNGSALDGKMTLPTGQLVYFDIKGFGFQAHKIEILKKRLEDALQESVLIRGSWDVSIDLLQELLGYNGFTTLVADIQLGSVVRRGRLEFTSQTIS